MWLPFMLLAFMASGSACPNLCECHQSKGATTEERVRLGVSSPVLLLEVTCKGLVPELSEVPTTTKRLSIDSADEEAVMGFLSELAAASNSSYLEGSSEGAGDQLNATSGYNFENSTGVLPYLEELSVTKCSLVFFNVTWQGLERLRSLNLSCNDLPRLSIAMDTPPAMNLSALTCLDLSDNWFTVVSADKFRTLVGLVRLILNKNAIATVHEDAFQKLDRLEYLDLSDNRLSNLPDGALTPLCSLQKLDLSGNKLEVLGARWFESLDRLRELDVSRNGLAKVASGTLQPLPGLSVLRLAENPLRERDVSLLLGTGRRLETVDASRIGLARVPAALTRSVRALRLAGNSLTIIRGGDLDSYPLLRTLDISDNRLVQIEDDALGRLEILEDLDISGNKLIQIPRSLPASLSVLKLQGNAITKLKADDLQGLYNLKHLTLNENNIAEIEVGCLGQLLALTVLDLSDNPIKALPTNTLSGPSNLATLRMSGLTALRRERQEQSDMAFPVPTPDRLVILDVSRSPILAGQLLADDATLSACKSLTELDLSHNELTTLRFDLPFMLPQLRVLGLEGNRWNCTEDLYWLGEWIRQRMEHRKDLESLLCAQPDELSNTFLYDLPSPRGALPTNMSNSMINSSTTSSSSFATERIVDSNEFNTSVSSNFDAKFTREIIASSTARTTGIGYPYKMVTERKSVSKDNKTQDITKELKVPHIKPKANNSTQIRQVPTESATSPDILRNKLEKSKEARTNKGPRTNQNSIRDVVGPSSGRGRTRQERPPPPSPPTTLPPRESATGVENELARRSFDNQVDVADLQERKGGRPKKLTALADKIAFAAKSSKLASTYTSSSTPSPSPSSLSSSSSSPWVDRKKQQLEKHSTRANSLGKENLIALGSPGTSVNTTAEELNGGRTTADSGARVSEPLSANGAHPGMLILVGAVLGAAAALTVVLSRRAATVRRTDRYHRHENIEVHTLTPSVELW